MDEESKLLHLRSTRVAPSRVNAWAVTVVTLFTPTRAASFGNYYNKAYKTCYNIIMITILKKLGSLNESVGRCVMLWVGIVRVGLEIGKPTPFPFFSLLFLLHPLPFLFLPFPLHNSFIFWVHQQIAMDIFI